MAQDEEVRTFLTRNTFRCATVAQHSLHIRNISNATPAPASAKIQSIRHIRSPEDVAHLVHGKSPRAQDGASRALMVQKLAIPVFGHRISARLDCSESIVLVTIKDNMIVERKEMRWAGAHVLQRIHMLLQEDVAVLICGGISDTSARVLRDSNIDVIPWIRGEVDEALSRFLQGTLCTPLSGELKGRIS